MTPPRFRRHHRSPEGRRPVPGGDFPGTDRAVEQWLGQLQTDPADGTTVPLAALRGQPRYAPAAAPHPDNIYAAPAPADVREAGGDTGPLARLRARPPAPDTFPALQDPPPAALPAPPPVRRPGDETIARDLAAGWPRLFEVRCAYPAASHATPIPCGAVHRDGAALSFRGLRASAFAAGWHVDAFGRLACPRCCQSSPEYRTLYPLTLWDGDAADACLAGDFEDERRHRAAAEHALFRDVLGARARHAGGPR